MALKHASRHWISDVCKSTVVAMTKRMLETQKLKNLLGTKAVVNAVYTLIRCPTKTLHFVTVEVTGTLNPQP